MMWRIRPANKGDEAFVYSSWLKSHRDAPAVKGVPNTIYYKGYHDLIEAVLGDRTIEVWVACAPDDDAQIFGYVVGRPGLCHWVYVKHPFRTFGVARDLMSRINPLVHTTLARQSSLFKNSTFDPFKLWSYVK